MEWVKTLHLFGVIGWMTGVFYMPRLLVNIVEAHRAGEPTRRLQDMAYRLFRFCTGLAVVAIGAGLWLWFGYGYSGAWLHAKVALVALLVVYWAMTRVWLSEMMRGEYRRSSMFLRVYNEMSLVLFVPILILAVTKLV